uniref:Uncharacterized protein n=1 Tax=Anopheles minimus TaxID=112268 RepID=A0A182WIE7_9DIPT
MYRSHGFAVFVVLTIVVLCADVRANYLSNVNTSKQSYFFGAKDAGDILCFSKTLLKGSIMPQDVSYTNPTAMKNINFITLAADKFSPHGFTADITSGKIGTVSATVKINAKSILPYAIEIKFYCVKGHYEEAVSGRLLLYLVVVFVFKRPNLPNCGSVGCVAPFDLGEHLTNTHRIAFHETMVWLRLVSLCALCVAGSWALSLVVTQEQSYFFGVKPGDNLLCYTKTLPKGSALPASVSYTNPNDKKINFVTMNADKYSPYGYTVDKTDGQLASATIGFRINGPSPLHYAITIYMYCEP